jgi:hypothetical protein
VALLPFSRGCGIYKWIVHFGLGEGWEDLGSEYTRQIFKVFFLAIMPTALQPFCDCSCPHSSTNMKATFYVRLELGVSQDPVTCSFKLQKYLSHTAAFLQIGSMSLLVWPSKNFLGRIVDDAVSRCGPQCLFVWGVAGDRAE